jgi:ribosomal protein L16 Arg81 hydroxylase
MADAIDAAALLFGTSSEAARFFSEHWGKSTVKLRAPASLGELFSLDELAAHAFSPLSPGRGGDTLHFRAAYTDTAGRARAFGGPLEMARQLLDAGMTLSFDGLQRSHPKLQALAAAMGRLIGTIGPVTINCFLSPDGSGLGWHFDCTHGLILQISGEKRWQLGPQVMAPPLHLELDGPSTPAIAAMLKQLGHHYPEPSDHEREIDLAPNDILYVPPGLWHRASARGTSCHLSVIVRPFGFARVLRAMIAAMALRRPEWRSDLQRLGVAGDLAPPSSRPELASYFATQLEEARRELAQLTPERMAKTMESLAQSPLLRDLLLNAVTEDVV